MSFTDSHNSSISEITVPSKTPSNATTSTTGSLSLRSSSATASDMSSIDLENPKNRTPIKVRTERLKSLVNDDTTLLFEPECIKKHINWSKIKPGHNQIDNITTPNPEMLLDDLPAFSPKLYTLIKKIEALDSTDLKTEGTLYKHMIFTDMKSNSYGVKMLASVLAAKGMRLGFTANKNPDYDINDDEEGKTKKKQNKFNKIHMLNDDELRKTKNNNFYIMSSVNIFDQPLSVYTKKEMLSRFNSRPDNIHGENTRFILMDSGFKEGIDLFDIKYIHIFEPQTTYADQKQVIGRGTRTCGQKGIRFHPSKGWPLHVQIYDMTIPKEIQKYMGGEENLFSLYLKSLNLDLKLFNFVKELEDATITGSVDHYLNENIHSFKITGGAKKKTPSIPYIDTEDLNPTLGLAIAEKLLTERLRLEPKPEMSHDQMKLYIKNNFEKYKWKKAKMENLCEENNVENGKLLTYTPTQQFIKDYFTPQANTKGVLLWHSTGSGKTCSAIATASNEFEKQGYTILWVTRTTLKSDVWKNMFDMVCHEVLRSKISDEGLVIPSQQPKRMKLLSNSWRIRPMSYKQFSNLVSKKNNNYDRLVKINGEHDPLRKTLIVVDEAHKLYGGEDLSSIERPDMSAFHKSLMHSYAVSGQDSVRLLLMTATPITTNPMEIVKLINLCKPVDKQMPTHFDDFTKRFLNNETIKFTPNGLKLYHDDIAGVVSYLNREKDARQFAQPIIHHIKTPLIHNMNDVYEFDRRIARNNITEQIIPIQKQVDEITEALKGELSDLDPNKFQELMDVCNDNPYVFDDVVISDKFEKKCKNITRKNMRNVVERTKKYIKNVRLVIKELRENIKELNKNKNTKLDYIKNLEKQDPSRWEQFKNSAYYNIRYKCGKTIKSNLSFDEMIKSHMDIIPYTEAIDECNEKITELKDTLKIKLDVYKTRVNELKYMIKHGNLNDIEKTVVRSAIKEKQKLTRKSVAKTRRETKKAIGIVDKDIHKIIKSKKNTIKNIKRKIKEDIKAEKNEQKHFDKKAKAMKKILRKAGDYKDEIKNNILKQFVINEKSLLQENLIELRNELDKELQTKMEKIEIKNLNAAEKTRKQQEKELKKTNKTKKNNA